MALSAGGAAVALGIAGAVLGGIWLQFDETSRQFPLGDPVVVTDFQPVPDHPDVLRADVVLNRTLNQTVSIEASCTRSTVPGNVKWVEGSFKNRPTSAAANVSLRFRFSGDILALSRYRKDEKESAGVLAGLLDLVVRCTGPEHLQCLAPGTNITVETYSRSPPLSVARSSPMFVRTASGYRVDLSVSYWDMLSREDFTDLLPYSNPDAIAPLPTAWGVTMRVAGESRPFQFPFGADQGPLAAFLTTCETTARADAMRMERERFKTGQIHLTAGLSAIAAEDWARAADQLTQATQYGVWTAKSALELGRLFRDGKGFAAEPASAWAWFRMSIEHADAVSAAGLAGSNGAKQADLEAVEEAARQELCQMARRKEAYGGTPEKDAAQWCKAGPSRPI